tara:strand:- start:949 stop:1197 length:249 start_codon:yes stop_codon:yes gene_type:complete
MIFLALTRKGYESYQSIENKLDFPLWLSAGIFSKVELAILRESGAIFSEFKYVIEPSDIEAISCAIATIKEHHPNEAVWVES